MRIGNMMLPNGTTKCWDSKGVYYVPTDSSQIRPIVSCKLWKPPNPPRDSFKKSSVGVTQGWKSKEPLKED